MDCDDVDLYGDLENFEKQNNQQDYKAENEKLKIKCEKLEKQLSETVTKLEKLEENHAQLETRVSSLLKTARLEVSRKDRMISELRQTIDNAAFRRPNYKIPRKNEQPNEQSNLKTPSTHYQNNNRDDKFISKHSNDSTRHNDNNKKNVNVIKKITEIVDNKIQNESNYIEPIENKNLKYEKYEEDTDEEEIYQHDKVCTTVFGERLKKKLHQQMLDEAAADKARKEKEIDIKSENIDIKIENTDLIIIENQKNSLTTDLKVNNKENYYRLIPLDLKYEDKSKPDNLLDKIKSYDVNNQNNKRSREDSPSCNKKRKLNDDNDDADECNQRDIIDRHRSRDGSSSSYDDRRTYKDDTEYFCSTKPNDIDLCTRKTARNERQQRQERNDNNTNNFRTNNSRKNTRSSDRLDRNSSQIRCGRNYLKEPVFSKRIDQRSRSRSTNRKQINDNKNWRRNNKNSPRRNKRFDKSNDRYRDKNYERENSRGRSRDNGNNDERERNEQKNKYDNNKEKYNERINDKLHDNIKICDKEKEKFINKNNDEEKKKQSSSILEINKSTDLRDRLRKRNLSNSNSISPVKKTNLKIEKDIEKNPEIKDEQIKDPRIIKTSNIINNEKIENTNDIKKNKKINNIEEILNTLEEGEIAESPVTSPIKLQTNNDEIIDGSLNDSMKEEKIENIEKYILKSMSIDEKLINLSPTINNNEHLLNDNKITIKTCTKIENKTNNILTEPIDSIEELVKKITPNDKDKVDEKYSTISEKTISKIENNSAENRQLLNLLGDESDQIVIKSSSIKNSTDNIVNDNHLIDNTEKNNVTNDSDKDTSSFDKEKINEDQVKHDDDNKSISSSDTSKELVEISPISSSPEKSIEQDFHENTNIIMNEKISETITTITKTTTTVTSDKSKKIDNNKKNIIKSSIKNTTEIIQKNVSKDNDKDKKKVITVLRRRRGPVKLSDSSKCMTLVRSDTKK